jgi:hypothetical protein
MIPISVISAMAGTLAVVVGLVGRRRRNAMASTPTVGCVDVPNVAAVDAAVPCEVKGTAERAEHAMAGPFSGTQCVWYSAVVKRRYEGLEKDRDGDTRRVTKTEVVSRQTSSEPFLVRDVSGSVRIHPEGARVSGMVRTVSRFEPSSDGGTLGYEHTEHVLREGTPVYVLGGALRDQAGSGWIQRPSQGPYLISTKDEEELTRNASGQMYVGLGIGVAALTTSLALGVVALVG